MKRLKNNKKSDLENFLGRIIFFKKTNYFLFTASSMAFAAAER